MREQDNMTYQLVRVLTPVAWRALHDIRRVELFEAKGRVGVYSETHPDDVAAFAYPFVLTLDGRAIGTTRIDVLGEGRGVMRLVAISEADQGQGHGRVLEQMVSARAKALGIDTFLVNAAPEAVGFYEKTGWKRHVWDAAELVGLAASCIQMRKLI